MVIPWRWRMVPGLVGLVLGAGLAGRAPPAGPGWSAGGTLAESLGAAAAAFAEGRYQAAADQLAGLEEVFGGEPEYRGEPVQRAVWPMRALAEFRAGRPGEAAAAFRRAADLRPPPDPLHPRLLYGLVQAARAAGDPAAAHTACADLRRLAAGTAVADLAQFEEGSILAEEGRVDEALGLWRELSGRLDPTAPLAQQARLEAARACLAAERPAEVAGWLHEAPWTLATMPDLGNLAQTALRAGDRALEDGRAEEAVACYRLVPPREELLQRLEERLAAGRAEERRKAWRLAEETVEDEYRRSLQARLEADWAALRQSEDYTAAFRLHLAQALLLARRPREALVLGLVLRDDPALPEAWREEAALRAVVAAQTLPDWPRALLLARQFLERHPGSAQAPTALFLTARALQESGRPAEAITLLGELRTAHPDHPQASRWLYARGFALLGVGRLEEADRDFAEFLQLHPDRPAAWSVRLARALVRHLDRRLEESWELLEALQREAPAGHPLRPEILYRRALNRYASRRPTEALAELGEFLHHFAMHPLAAEARVLRGDLLMGEGDLARAALDFAQIEPERGHLFVYATFQTGKIWRAQGDFTRLARHFERYLDRPDLPPGARLAEAAHQIVWALAQEGRPEQADPVFQRAFAAWGDDPACGEMEPLLAAWERHLRRFPRAPGLPGTATEPVVPDPAAAAGDAFTRWREEAEAAARREGRLTWWSRLALHRARAAERAGEVAEARATAAEVHATAGLERLDPEGLAACGHLLAETDPAAARALWEHLLERHPRHPARASAYHGLGSRALREGRSAEALDWFDRLARACPAHPLAVEAGLGAAEALLALGRPQESGARAGEVMRLRQARGRAQARALRALARAEEAGGEPARALGCWQRVHTLYRAWPDLAAEAYRESARLFEALGDLPAAWRTWRELAADPALADGAGDPPPAREIERLAALLPPEATTSVASPADPATLTPVPAEEAPRP